MFLLINAFWQFFSHNQSAKIKKMQLSHSLKLTQGYTQQLTNYLE